MRPLLAPGLHVLRRRDDRVQVGLHPATSVVLLDDYGAHLRRLQRGEADPCDIPAEVRPLLRQSPAMVKGRVSVLGFGHPSGRHLPARLSALVDAAGLTPARKGGDLVLVAGVGEPPRELVDPLTQAGTPYLLLRFVEGYAVVGPFVLPGRTACLRCADAALADEDPSWPLLVEQYVRACTRDRDDGVGEPFDPVLADLACAWVVRDATSYLSGIRPSSWSSSLRLDPQLHEIETTPWLRHPSCGCSWTMTR